MKRPHTTVVLAMSADGKIADVLRSPARFGSPADKAHLEKQIACADAVLFGAGTLRAYGTSLSVTNPELLQHRQAQGKQPQPVQIVASASARINRDIHFFQQPIPRWLLTTNYGIAYWGIFQSNAEFERILIAETKSRQIDWGCAFTQLNVERLVVLGGGKLVASLLAVDLIDEFWLTVCPLLIGGASAPTPVEGNGLLPMRHLDLLEVETVGQEVFLHYRLKRRD